MSCCGKAVKIAKGNAVHIAIDLFKLPKDKYEYADPRLYICWECEEQTWLTKWEYTKFILAHAKEVIKNLDDLTKLPPLPKEEQEKGKKLFCRLCKCFIPAKTYVKEEICPLNKWEQ